LSSRGCLSNVAAAFYNGGHAAMGARQVVLAQGALHGDEGDNSALGMHTAGAAGDNSALGCTQ
jgi:hypothetical protein